VLQEVISKVSRLLEADQGEPVSPAQTAKVRKDLTLAQRLQQAIAGEVKNLLHPHSASRACHINAIPR
jgi:hypothetical protein